MAWVLKHRSVKQNSLGAFTISATGFLLGLGQDAYLLLRLVAHWEREIHPCSAGITGKLMCSRSQFTAVKIHVV